MTENDKVLDVPGVHAELIELGFEYTLKAVRYMATNRRLPFFVGPDGRRLFLTRSALRAWVTKQQTTAQQQCP